MLKISILGVLLLGYFGACAYIVLYVYDGYKVGSVALPLLAQRDALTTMLGLLVLDGLMTNNSTRICSGTSAYEKLYATALANEETLLEYKKSTKSVFTAYSDIITQLDSNQLCDIFSDRDSNLAQNME